MWDEIPASEGLTAEAAKPKGNRAPDAPTRQPMKAGVKPAQQRKPNGDQKRHRRQMARQASGEYGPEGYRTLHCPACGGSVAGDYSDASCTSCSATYNPIDKADATALGLREDEVIRLSLGNHYVVAVPMTSVMATRTATTSTAHTKESTAMTQQPTEADLIQRLASATSLVQQTAISEQLEALRTASRESAAMEGTLDWNAMGVLPPTHMQAVASSLAGIPEDDDAFGSLLPPMTASTRLGHSEATDWMADLTPSTTLDSTLSTVARAEATRWFENVYGPVKQDAQEFSTQAHNAAVRDCSKFALQSVAARSVYLDQIRHLASREGISLVALDETVDTYVSDGKTTQPVGVGASDSASNGSMDEWTIGTDLNGGEDPKSTNAEAPSLTEGDTPEGDHSESVDNPNFGEGPDKSQWNVGNTDDLMKTQGSRRVASEYPGMVLFEGNTYSAIGLDGFGIGDFDTREEAEAALVAAGGNPSKVVDTRTLGSTQGGLVMRLASVRTAGIPVSKVKIVDRAKNIFSGEDRSGNTVTFVLDKQDAEDVRSVMFGDLAQNFSGLEIDHSAVLATDPDGGVHYSSLNVEAHMAAEFGGSGRGITTIAQEEQSTSADGLSSADAPEEAPSMSEGGPVEGDHAEGYTQNPGEGAKDLSSATDSDRPGGGVEWGSTAAKRPAPLHSLASIGETVARNTTGNQQVFATALTRAASLSDSVGGVSIRRVAHRLVASPDLPLNIRLALGEHLAGDSVTVGTQRTCDICEYEEGTPGTPALYDGKTVVGPWANMCERHFDSHGTGLGTGRGQRLVLGSKQASQSCSVCGDAIASDGDGYHHDNGEKHDHEAKPGGSEGGESKEGQRAPFAREAAAPWPMMDNPNFPGEQMPSCPKCGASVIMEGTPLSEMGKGPMGTTLVCANGHRSYFPNDKQAAKQASREIQSDSGGRRYVSDRRDGMVFRYYEDGSVTILDASKRPGTNGTIGHTGPNPDTIPVEFGGTGPKVAGSYAGGSPKHGDTAVCHADGLPIEFFDGAWYHYAGGPAHNDVHPGTPREIADGTAMGSKVASDEGKKCPECGTYNDPTAEACEGCNKPFVENLKESSRTASFRQRVQAGLSRIAGGDFSLSDAKNEEGEWIMSPEQIRAEMNYDPSEDYDPYEDGGWHEGSKQAAGESCPGSGKRMTNTTKVNDGKNFGKVLGSCPSCNKRVMAKGGIVPRHTTSGS